jgi:hypothetical protein
VADRIIHIAGYPLRVGNLYRQRCGWCPAILIDGDLSREMVAPGSERDGPMFWETGALIEVATDGGFTSSALIPHKDGDKLPLRACAAPAVKLQAVPNG